MSGDLAAVALGGALGALARLALIRVTSALRTGHWDARAWATLLANGIGCAIFGLWTVGFDPTAFGEFELVTAPRIDLLFLAGICLTYSCICGNRCRA